MRFVLRVVPVFIVEILARLCGYCVGLVHPHGSFKAERIVRGMYWGARLGAKSLWVGRGVQFEGDNLEVGNGVRLYDGSQYVTGSGGHIKIGGGTHISRLSIVSGLGGVTIGRGCAISSHVGIYSITGDTRAASLADADRIKKPVVIGDNVYIGLGVKVIPGVTIGDNAVIAAGAVVIRDVPAGNLARGVPALSRPMSEAKIHDNDDEGRLSDD